MIQLRSMSQEASVNAKPDPSLMECPFMLEAAVTWIGRNIDLPGVSRLIRSVFPPGPYSRRWVSGVRQRADGMQMDLDTRQVIDWAVCFRGSYEPHLGPVFRAVLPRGGVAVDIGANVGVHSLTLARIVGKQGHVFAYEPNPDIYAKLIRNIGLNDLNQVTCFDTALGEAPGIVQLRVPRSDTEEAGNPGLASVMALDTAHDVVDVSVEPLDSLLRRSLLTRLDLIKIDVQGYEPFVFRGMQEILERLKPAVIFEYEDWAWKKSGGDLGEVSRMLLAAGYGLWSLSESLGSRKALADGIAEVGLHHIEIVALPKDDIKTRQICKSLNLQPSE